MLGECKQENKGIRTRGAMIMTKMFVIQWR